MRMLLFALPVVAVIILFIKAMSKKYVKSRCTAETEGRLISIEDSAEATGGSLGSAVYNAIYFPIYEYVVDGMAYWAQLENFSRNLGSFAKKVDVLYDPGKPETCYIAGELGNIVSTYNKDEYDRSGGGDNLTSDYKWRP